MRKLLFAIAGFFPTFLIGQQPITINRIDSLLRHSKVEIFDGLYPNVVNSKIKIVRSIVQSKTNGLGYKIYKYYDSHGSLLKYKVIYKKNGDNQGFQVFLQRIDSFIIGSIYKTTDFSADDHDYGMVPIIGPSERSFYFADKDFNESYIVNYNYTDTLFHDLQFDKINSLSLVEVDSCFKPRLIISKCLKDQSYSIFSCQNLSNPLSEKFNLNKILSTSLKDLFKINHNPKFLDDRLKKTPIYLTQFISLCP